jgi:hypothetical protein
MAPAQAFVFDADGTLFDVHSIVAALWGATVKAEPLSLRCRAKQFGYSRLHGRPMPVRRPPPETPTRRD